jgi:hypothetical protein
MLLNQGLTHCGRKVVTQDFQQRRRDQQANLQFRILLHLGRFGGGLERFISHSTNRDAPSRRTPFGGGSVAAARSRKLPCGCRLQDSIEEWTNLGKQFETREILAHPVLLALLESR